MQHNTFWAAAAVSTKQAACCGEHKAAQKQHRSRQGCKGKAAHGAAFGSATLHFVLCVTEKSEGGPKSRER